MQRIAGFSQQQAGASAAPGPSRVRGSTVLRAAPAPRAALNDLILPPSRPEAVQTSPIIVPGAAGIGAGSAAAAAAAGAGASSAAAAVPQLIAPNAPQASRRGLMKSALAVAGGLAICPCCPSPAQASGNAKFDYGTLSGPASWGGACASGTRQSPIDIPLKAILASSKRIATGVGPGPSCKPASLDPRGYKPVKPRILNTGVGTMQANFEKGSQTMFCGGLELELLQFHFHTPSEHAFDGERAAMEVHLVHRNVTTGGLAVIGILMVTGNAANQALSTCLKYAPARAREEIPSPANINPAMFLPKGPMQYVRYAGSLTTPGCAEGVDWYVMLDTIQVSPDQVIAFASYVSGGRSLAQNSRPVQPLNGRAFDMQYNCA